MTRLLRTRPTRRSVLAGATAASIAAALAPRLRHAHARPLPPPAEPAPGRTVEVELAAAERRVALPCFGGATLPCWTFADGPAPPVIRLRLGDRLKATLRNRLPRKGETASIHWHGIRLPNSEDGVPFLTQAPVEIGDSYAYDFTPPDTGTYFFHTHCNTAEQLNRGLLGILIVDGDVTEPYDGETTLVLRDWRIDATGFLPAYTRDGAARAGTFGSVRSANGAVDPTIRLPASGDCRLRILNVDRARSMDLGIEGADAAIIAIDGVAVPPFPLRSWRLPPAGRIDLAIRAPRQGGIAGLFDYFAAEPVALAHFAGTGSPHRATSFDPAPLRAGRMTAPDLAGADRLRFDFSATSGATLAAAADPRFIGVICTASDSFWAINKQAWPGHGRDRLPAPLAVLELGKSYRFELANLTPHQHPIHIHGHHFTVLRSNKRDLPVHRSDTVLLLPDERMEVAFVADNPGDWMFHCHIIEHQESGMMGYVRVA